jgi:hypothetical protein
MGGLGNGGWRGVLRVAQRESPLPGEGLCKLGLGRPAKAGVGAFGVMGPFNSLGCITCRTEFYSLQTVAVEKQNALENQY